MPQTKYSILLLGLFLVLLESVVPSMAQAPTSEQDPHQEILFKADTLIIDDRLGVVTATGNVRLVTQGRTLYADTLTYHRDAEVITASGSIELHEPNGEILYADTVEVSTDMRNAFLENIRIFLTDNSQFAGYQAELENQHILRVRRIVYSSCFLCPHHPERPPLWQIRADRAVYDKQQHHLRFRDVTLDFWGLPILYLPYISLPDPTVRRRSGLIGIDGGWHNDFGAFGTVRSYVALASALDATTTVTAFTQTYPLIALQMRQGFDRGRITFEGAVTRNPVTDRHNVNKGDRWRGQLQLQTHVDINDEWRLRGNFHRVSDVSFLRHHADHVPGNFLESRGIVEGFLDRDYAMIQTSWFQSLQHDEESDELLILPLARYTAIGDPQGIVGGRATFHAELRHIDHQDDTTQTDYAETTRLSLEPSWQRIVHTNIGMWFMLGGRLRSDLYLWRNRPSTDTADTTKPSWHFRFLPEVWGQTRYPFLRVGQTFDQVITPRVAFFVAPRMSKTRFPNEDSLDIVIDSTNLFTNNRFSGTDRQEGGQRLTYGLSYTLYHKEGNHTAEETQDDPSPDQGNDATFFVGQSLRLSGDRPFRTGSGLDRRRSDIVAHASLNLVDWFKMFYDIRLDEEDISPRTQNVHVRLASSSLTFTGLYGFWEQQHDARNRRQPEEEFLTFDIRAQMSQYWWTSFSHSHAFRNDPGPRKTSLEIGYEDECFRFTVGARQDHTSFPGVEDGLTFSFHVSLKTLAETIQ